MVWVSLVRSRRCPIRQHRSLQPEIPFVRGSLTCALDVDGARSGREASLDPYAPFQRARANQAKETAWCRPTVAVCGHEAHETPTRNVDDPCRRVTVRYVGRADLGERAVGDLANGTAPAATSARWASSISATSQKTSGWSTHGAEDRPISAPAPVNTAKSSPTNAGSCPSTAVHASTLAARSRAGKTTFLKPRRLTHPAR